MLILPKFEASRYNLIDAWPHPTNIKMMLENPQRYTVTAALIYANGPIHIGHLAGCYLPADIYVRYLRSTGKDVAFISGTDEHGVPITIKAKKEGITPQEVVDKYYGQIKGRSTSSAFRSTSTPVPRTRCTTKRRRSFSPKLYEKGDFDEEVTDQYYDEVANSFWPTATLWVPAPFAATQTRTATSANAAARPSAQRNCSNRTPCSPAPNP